MPSIPTPRTLIVFVSFMLALSLTTGTALARFVFAGPRAESALPTAGPDVELVRGFYAAINMALQTGQSEDLASIVAADFTEHPNRPGAAPGPAGLIETLLTARVSFPDLQIVVEDVRSAGDQVSARVRVQGVAGHFLGLPLGWAQAPWGPIDLFRVAGGLIAEHWGVPVSAARFAVVTQGSIHLPADPWRRVSLERRRYGPDAAWSGEIAVGPVLMLGETGSLTVVIEEATDTPVLLVHPGPAEGTPWGEPISEGAIAAIDPGDLLVLPQGAQFMTANWETVTAESLVLTFDVPAIPGGSPMAETLAPDGIARQHLATGPASLIPVDAVVRIGRITLAGGSELPLHTAAGPELLIVESGKHTLTSGEELAWIRYGSKPESTGEHLAVLEPGDGASVSPGAAATYRSTGPATVLLLTILPLR